MIVWMVMQNVEYEGSFVESVWSTEKGANEELAELELEHANYHYSVETIEVDVSGGRSLRYRLGRIREEHEEEIAALRYRIDAFMTELAKRESLRPNVIVVSSNDISPESLQRVRRA